LQGNWQRNGSGEMEKGRWGDETYSITTVASLPLVCLELVENLDYSLSPREAKLSQQAADAHKIRMVHVEPRHRGATVC